MEALPSVRRPARAHVGEIVALFAVAASLYLGATAVGTAFKYAHDPFAMADGICTDVASGFEDCVALQMRSTPLQLLAPNLANGLIAAAVGAGGLIVAKRRRAALITAGVAAASSITAVVLRSYVS